MSNRIYTILVGIINQPQFWIRHGEGKGNPETSPSEQLEHNVRVYNHSSGAVYGLGLIGACIYYQSRGASFQQKVLGFFKALVWPVFLVKGVLEFLENE